MCTYTVVELSLREGRGHIVSTRALCARNSDTKAQKAPFSHYKGYFLAILAISPHLKAL